MVEQLNPDRTVFAAELADFLTPVPQLQAGGIDHFGEEQGIGCPTSNQASKDAVADPREWRLQHPAVQLSRRSTARELERI